jgi:hypothetical protein
MIRYEVNCTNDESDVGQCISEWKDVQCPNGNDVGIKCSMWIKFWLNDSW